MRITVILLKSFGLVAFVVAGLSLAQQQQSSDNQLQEPSGRTSDVPTPQTCDFRNASRPCKFMYNYKPQKTGSSYFVSVQFAPGKTQEGSMAKSYYIRTAANRTGLARYGTRPVYTSVGTGVRALCIAFSYKIYGDASLQLAEMPNGQAEHVFWPANGSRNDAVKGQWRYHVSQVTQSSRVKLFFKAAVNNDKSGVLIKDIRLYNSTCNIKVGDTSKEYTGSSRAGSGSDAPYWPTNATIPFEIQDGFSAEQQAMILRFMRDMMAKTCLRFVQHRGETDYLNFIHAELGYGCSSDLGDVGMTKVTLDDDCFSKGYWNIAHMSMHALGLRHEHIRPDRNSFVQVFMDNVDPIKGPQFDMRSSGNPNVLKIQYDWKSVMHFPKDMYSVVPGLDTMERINPANGQLDRSYILGNTDGPTALDFQKVSAIYCGGVTKSPTTPLPSMTPPTTTTTTVDPSMWTPCTSTSSINSNSGIIRNDQINGYYRNGEHCGWLVTVDPGYTITFSFTMLDMDDSYDCTWDSVQVIDGRDGTMPPLVTVCGRETRGDTYQTATNQMLVLFTTDSNTAGAGFALDYKKTDIGVDPSSNAALSPADCNFDQSACGYTLSDGKLKWSRRKLDGLPNDQTSGSSNLGFYLSLDASTATAQRQFSTLRSSKISSSDMWACYTFWYRFIDSDQTNEKLEIWSQDLLGNNNLLWSSNTDANGASAYSDWQMANVALDGISVDTYRIIVNGTINRNGRRGGIAVDDIVLTQDYCNNNDFPPPMYTTTEQPDDTTTTIITPAPSSSSSSSGNSPLSCTFESGSCGWKNASIKADSNFLSWSGRSTSGSVYGVQYDHTKQTASGKYFLLNSNPNQKQTARLEASIAANSGYKCFELYYLMYGRHLGRVRVLARAAGSDDEMVLFEANGNKGPKWTLAQASLEGYSRAYTLIVEGYTTGQNDGDVAIDDFVLRKTDCYTAPIISPPYVSPSNAYVCDFEDGLFCKKSVAFVNDPNGINPWADSQGGQSYQGGPDEDHSRPSYEGHFAAMIGGDKKSTGTLTSKQYNAGEVNCMTFWYWLSAQDTGDVKIVIKEGSSVSTLFTTAGASHMTGEWINPQVSIKQQTTGKFSIQIVGISGGQSSFVGIDDVAVSYTSKCAPMNRVLVLPGGRRRRAAVSPIKCRFGNGDFCNEFQNNGWKVVSTSVKADVSGPDDRFAHMTSGRLVVAAGNSRSLPLPSADLTSNVTGTLTSLRTNGGASQSCLRFFYKISGWFRDLPMDVLNVFIVSPSRSSSSNNRRLIASLSGSQTPPTDSLDDWIEEKLTVFEATEYKVVFEATTGDSWLGTLSIDDVQLLPTICPSASFQ